MNAAISKPGVLGGQRLLMADHQALAGELGLQVGDRQVEGFDLVLNGEMGGDPRGFWNHDAVRDLMAGVGDAVEHAEVTFQHEGVVRLAFAHSKAVDGELAHGDAVGVMLRHLGIVLQDPEHALCYAAMPLEDTFVSGFVALDAAAIFLGLGNQNRSRQRCGDGARPG